MWLTPEELDFGRYLALKRRAGSSSGYAYGPDLRSLKRLSKLWPLPAAARAVVRWQRTVLDSELLGTMVRVGPEQFPELDRIARGCARRLGIAAPQLFVRNQSATQAYTYGTQEDAFVVLHSGLVDQLDPDELRFVLGHELGHIQHQHVVYSSLLRLLSNTAGLLVRWSVPAAGLGLLAWSRRAEVTCDRAGLLCCRDLDVACRALLKLACGSSKLYEQLNLEAYLAQLSEGRGGVGRFRELFASHPYVPKRIEALRLFAQSAPYRRALGLAGGLPLQDVDNRTEALMGVIDGGGRGGTGT